MDLEPLLFRLVIAGAILILCWMVTRFDLRMEKFLWAVPNLWALWRTRQMVMRISELVLLVGFRNDGTLKGQAPAWLAGFNKAPGGNGEFEVLVVSNEKYHLIKFQVKCWVPSYDTVESCSADTAQRVMELHLKALGRWKPIYKPCCESTVAPVGFWFTRILLLSLIPHLHQQRHRALLMALWKPGANTITSAICCV